MTLGSSSAEKPHHEQPMACLPQKCYHYGSTRLQSQSQLQQYMPSLLPPQRKTLLIAGDNANQASQTRSLPLLRFVSQVILVVGMTRAARGLWRVIASPLADKKVQPIDPVISPARWYCMYSSRKLLWWVPGYFCAYMASSAGRGGVKQLPALH